MIKKYNNVIFFLSEPSETEISEVSTECKIPEALLITSLEQNNLARIHFNDMTSVHFGIPHLSRENNGKRVRIVPCGVFVSDTWITVVVSKRYKAIEEVVSIVGSESEDLYGILLRILFTVAMLYIDQLDVIDNETEKLEKGLKKRVNNKEIFQLMDYQRSLTAISTSLKGIDRIMKKITDNKERFRNHELLDDTNVAVLQAGGMAEIFSADLDALMDAFGSILSNNVNQIMKILTSLTLIVAIPTMIAGLYGMNLQLPLADQPQAFWIISGTAFLLAGVIGMVFHWRKML